MTLHKQPCAAPGCPSQQTSRTYSPFCSTHRRALQRHGDHQQRPVTLLHLGPHLRTVKAYQQRNPSSPAWAIIADRWETLTDHARGILAVRDAGRAFSRYEALAAEALVATADAAEPPQVTRVALGMFLLREAEPRRFASDAGFTVSLVRRVRKLAPQAVGVYWSSRAQRATKVYRDMPPQATKVLGAWLTACFAAPGAQLAALERGKADEARQLPQRLADAVGSLL